MVTKPAAAVLRASESWAATTVMRSIATARPAVDARRHPPPRCLLSQPSPQQHQGPPPDPAAERRRGALISPPLHSAAQVVGALVVLVSAAGNLRAESPPSRPGTLLQTLPQRPTSGRQVPLAPGRREGRATNGRGPGCSLAQGPWIRAGGRAQLEIAAPTTTPSLADLVREARTDADSDSSDLSNAQLALDLATTADADATNDTAAAAAVAAADNNIAPPNSDSDNSRGRA
jgi:hypothetical protein